MLTQGLGLWTARHVKSSPKLFLQFLQFVIKLLLPTLNLRLDFIIGLIFALARHQLIDIRYYGFK